MLNRRGKIMAFEYDITGNVSSLGTSKYPVVGDRTILTLALSFLTALQFPL